MKTSAALQGLKSLASKLHPQAPLTPKESAHLLNALTSSFRQHLDNAHPRTADNAGAQRPSRGDMRVPRSASLDADEHLATLLTSPLLVTGGLKSPRGLATNEDAVASANKELAHSPQLGPIDLLESYIEKGIATVAVAELCLQTFKNRLLAVPEDAHATIQARGAGRRVLSWLWKSQQLESPAFTGNIAMMNLLPFFLLRENMDTHLWTLLEHNPETDERSDVAEASRVRSYADLQQYSWKGRLLRGMVLTRFERPHSPLDATYALQTFSKAHDLSSSASSRTRRDMLGPAGAGLCAALTNKRRRPPLVKGDQYDKFIGLVDSWASPAQGQLERAKLLLYHPQRPDATPMYTLFQQLAQPGSANPMDERLRKHLLQPTNAAQRSSIHDLLTRMFLILEKDGLDDKVARLDAMTKTASLQPALILAQGHAGKDANGDTAQDGDESSGLLARLTPLRYVT